jgi:hypothetical protein
MTERDLAAMRLASSPVKLLAGQQGTADALQLHIQDGARSRTQSHAVYMLTISTAYFVPLHVNLNPRASRKQPWPC